MTNGNGAPPEAAPPPQLNVLAQYTKDLSFENPNAPGSLAPRVTEADRAAHRAFVATLGDKPIWNDFLPAA